VYQFVAWLWPERPTVVSLERGQIAPSRIASSASVCNLLLSEEVRLSLPFENVFMRAIIETVNIAFQGNTIFFFQLNMKNYSRQGKRRL
jgi:hypothetical protein